MTGSLFDQTPQQQGIARRDAAQASQEHSYKVWLVVARAIAAFHARNYGEVTSDDVRTQLDLEPWMHHNVMGAIFRDRMFHATGRFVMSVRGSARGRYIRTYRLAD